MTEKKIVVDKETAELEFNRFCDAWDIENEIADENDFEEKQDSADFEKAKRTIVNAIMSGRLILNDDSLPEFTTRNDQVVKFKGPTGETYTAMDKRKDPLAKMVISLSQLTGRSPVVFNRMDKRDFVVCKAIWLLFLRE